MQNKEADMIQTQQKIGWAYSDLKWLTDEGARLANQERNELLDSLGTSPRLSHSFMQTKVHTGNLSPGCTLCGQGFCSCMFINGLCTTHCFYCPQDRTIEEERIPFAEGIPFNLPDDYANYLHKFNFKGAGFSGGEPFLVFEKLLAYLKKIRQRFGKKIYLWVYTNGDLVEENKLKKLKEIGLDEIRFNVSARNYDFGCVKKAVGVIDTVTVEIPAIPEDFEIIKNSLVKMRKIGVKQLNLHQLNAVPCNYKNFKDRGYTFLHQEGIPILESELTALRIMRFANQHKIDLPINYCSMAYKARFQEKGNRERIAPYVRNDFEEITRAGYIRKLAIFGSRVVIKRIAETLMKRGSSKEFRTLKNAAAGIFLRSSLLKYVDIKEAHMIVTYFKPCVGIRGKDENGKKLPPLNEQLRFFVKQEKIFESKLFDEAAKRTFLKWFIERANEKETLAFFYKNHALQTQEDVQIMENQRQALWDLKKFEVIETGFPEIH